MKPTLIILTAMSLSIGACAKKSSNSASPTSTNVAPSGTSLSPVLAKAEAEKIFATRCTPCHGERGAGDGPASASLEPKPRNFQDAAWQKAVTDDHLIKIIQLGGAAVGKSAAMPPNPDLTSKPEIVTALKDKIRALAK